MAARPGYNQLNPFSNQPQYARQYSDSDADSYTSRNASSVPLSPAGYYDGTYTSQRKCHPPIAFLLHAQLLRSSSRRRYTPLL